MSVPGRPPDEDQEYRKYIGSDHNVNGWIEWIKIDSKSDISQDLRWLNKQL